MVLIRCPQCGQRVLNVATTCPKCSFLLIQNPNQEGGEQTLAECRRCGKMVDKHAVVCPYCAYPARARRHLRMAFWGVTGVVAAAAAAIVGTQIQAESSGRISVPSRSAAEPPPTPAVTPPSSQRDATPPGGPGPQMAARDTAPALRDTVPARTRPTQPDTMPAPRVIAPPVAAPRPDTTTAARPRDLRARWTLNWVNVREGRSVDFPIVRVLRPGVEVQIRDPRAGGWWEVYYAGERIGFIAGSELSEQPPPDTLGVPIR